MSPNKGNDFRSIISLGHRQRSVNDTMLVGNTENVCLDFSNGYSGLEIISPNPVRIGPSD